MGRKAGCVPVRRRPSGEWEVMLVQSRWTPEIWLFPKGGVESGEFAKEAAVRETCEEAGLRGLLGPKLGSWRFAKAADQKHKMWILFVTEEFAKSDKRWKERKKRLRSWYSFEDARRVMTALPDNVVRPELEEILSAAEKLLADVSGNGSNWKSDISEARRVARRARSVSSRADSTSSPHADNKDDSASEEDSDYRE